MERGKIERKEQEELERLKGIVRDQYEEKKDAYREKVSIIMQGFLIGLAKEVKPSMVDKIVESLLLLQDEFLDIERVAGVARHVYLDLGS